MKNLEIYNYNLIKEVKKYKRKYNKSEAISVFIFTFLISSCVLPCVFVKIFKTLTTLNFLELLPVAIISSFIFTRSIINLEKKDFEKGNNEELKKAVFVLEKENVFVSIERLGKSEIKEKYLQKSLTTSNKEKKAISVHNIFFFDNSNTIKVLQSMNTIIKTPLGKKTTRELQLLDDEEANKAIEESGIRLAFKK